MRQYRLIMEAYLRRTLCNISKLTRVYWHVQKRGYIEERWERGNRGSPVRGGRGEVWWFSWTWGDSLATRECCEASQSVEPITRSKLESMLHSQFRYYLQNFVHSMTVRLHCLAQHRHIFFLFGLYQGVGKWLTLFGLSSLRLAMVAMMAFSSPRSSSCWVSMWYLFLHFCFGLLEGHGGQKVNEERM